MNTRTLTRKAKFRTIKMGDIRVSPTAQRDLNLARVHKIAEDLDEDLIGTIEVSYRDGVYWVIDGQHRFNALKEFWGEGFEEWTLTVWCYVDLNEQQEAEMFLRKNDVLTVNAFDKFTKGVTAGRPAETDIDRIARSLDLKIGRMKADNTISSVSSLVTVYERFGPGGLSRTLSTIRDSFYGRGFEAQIIVGLARFLARYEGRIETDRLIQRLGNVAGGYKAILQKANIIREQMGVELPECVAASITEYYNKGARGTQSLGGWWKDAR